MLRTLRRPTARQAAGIAPHAVRHTLAVLAVACAGALLTAGCRKDLCFDHDEHSFAVKVDVAASWEQEWERAYAHHWTAEWDEAWPVAYDDLRPDIPDGLRVVAYHATEGTPVCETNLKAEGGRILSLPEGTHDLLMYNNDTEYIVFSGMEAAAGATASTRTVTRGNFTEMHAGERTVNPPDMLYGHFEEGHEAQRTFQAVTLPVEMRPLVYTYVVVYRFSRGLQHVALARGALAAVGAEAQVRSFGVPNYPGDHYTRADGTPATYMLNLEVRLVNGRFKNFTFDVTEQVEQQPRGGIIRVEGLEVTDAEAAGGSSGFVPDVEGWGDYEDIEMPIL